MLRLSRTRLSTTGYVIGSTARLAVRQVSNKRSPPSAPLPAPPPSGTPLKRSLKERLRYFWNHPEVRYVRAVFFVFSGIYFGGHVFVTHFYDIRPCEGISMLPTISSFGDYVLVSKHYRHGRGVCVGDIVSYRHPIAPGMEACKRVIGMPGDFVVRDTPGQGVGMMYQVPEGHCVVAGDNLKYSRDSRLFGPLPMALIRGKAIAKLAWYDENSWMPWFHALGSGIQDVEDDYGVD